jgi:N-acetylglutamate synthase-like GNAT family acetyltransferase
MLRPFYFTNVSHVGLKRMGEISVRPVLTKEDTNTFIRFLWTIYRDNPTWVPPLMMDRKKLMDRKKNPFYHHADAEFYIAERDGKMVGRVAAIVNHNHNKEHGDTVGFFGFFESVNDQAVANALFDKARTFLKSKGMTAMRGPANPSVNDEYGLLIEGFDVSPTVLMTYNPPYYINLMENYGFKKAKDLYAYLLSQDTVYSERLERANAIVKKRQGLTIRPIDMKHFNGDVNRIKDVYNKAWAKNWGAVPMTDEEIDALAADLKPVIVPGLVLFAENQGKTIGFALSLPDINIALKYNKNGGLLAGLFHLYTKKKKINIVRIIVLGVLPEYQHTGAAGVLFYETAARAKALGYQFGEASWILEDNEPMNHSAEVMNGTITKKYRIYERPL